MMIKRPSSLSLLVLLLWGVTSGLHVSESISHLSEIFCFKYLFIWLCWILVAACESCCSVAYGILVPHQGVNPRLPHCKADPQPLNF